VKLTIYVILGSKRTLVATLAIQLHVALRLLRCRITSAIHSLFI